MIETKEVILNTPRFKYNLKLYNKVTIVSNDRGASGKSLIGKTIRQIETNYTNSEFNMNTSILFLDGNISIDMIIKADADVIVLDEESRDFNTKVQVIKNTDYASEIYKSNKYFIIISRFPFEIYHSAQQVYDLYLDKTDNTRKLKPRYDMSKANSKTYREILTEDSGSGMRYFLRNNIPIKDYKGAGDIKNKIKNDEHIGKLVMFDLATMNLHFDRLYKEATVPKEKGSKPVCDLCDRQSFEQQLLFSSFILNSKYRDMILNPESYINYDKENPSLEHYYENLYNYIIQNEVNSNFNYTKSKVAKCHYVSCDRCKNKKCNIRDNNIKNKFLDFLKQNDLEYLVKEEKQIKDNSSTLNSIEF